jgi:hypothetical protein
MSNHQIQAHKVSYGYRPECSEFVLVCGYQFAIHIPEYLGKLVLKLPPPQGFVKVILLFEGLKGKNLEILKFFIMI